MQASMEVRMEREARWTLGEDRGRGKEEVGGEEEEEDALVALVLVIVVVFR
jgi:hypothetical protein